MSRLTSMRRRPFTSTAAVFVAAGSLLLAGCSNDTSPGPAAAPASPASPTPPATSPPAADSATPAPDSGTAVPKDLETPATPGTPQVAGVVAAGLKSPWGLAFLPGGDALVSERDTDLIKRIAPGDSVTEVGRVPGVDGRGEGGLLGITLPPGFPQDAWLYAYYGAGEENRIVRMQYDGTGGLGAPEVLVRGIPAGGIHNGGRLVFGPDGMLYAGTGEAGDRPLSQDLSSLGGKILRMTPDGKVPPDNPYSGSYIWTLGHRNVQGLAFDDRGRLWATEFGQNTWDELNVIEKGKNYGWPQVEGTGGASRFVDPLVTWRTSEASPSGNAVAGGAVYVAALRGQRLWQVPLAGDGGVGSPTPFFTEEYGRLRTVAQAPDGSLWLVTSNTDGRGSPRRDDDKILRLTV